MRPNSSEGSKPFRAIRLSRPCLLSRRPVARRSLPDHQLHAAGWQTWVPGWLATRRGGCMAWEGEMRSPKILSSGQSSQAPSPPQQHRGSRSVCACGSRGARVLSPGDLGEGPMKSAHRRSYFGAFIRLHGRQWRRPSSTIGAMKTRKSQWTDSSVPSEFLICGFIWFHLSRPADSGRCGGWPPALPTGRSHHGFRAELNQLRDSLDEA